MEDMKYKQESKNRMQTILFATGMAILHQES
jgi:hypothetical protein